MQTKTTPTTHQPRILELPVPPAEGHGPSDPRSAFAHAAAVAGAILAEVNTKSLRRPTPCSEFDVEDLTRHLVSISHRVVAIGRGQTADSIPLDAPGVETDDLAANWLATIETQAAEWSDDRLLAQAMVLPFATLPGAIAISIYTAEVLIHAWDLATALDLAPNWDEDLATEALTTIQMGIPAEGRGEGIPFDPVVPTAPDAPAMDRLVAWVGRQPR